MRKLKKFLKKKKTFKMSVPYWIIGLFVIRAYFGG